MSKIVALALLFCCVTALIETSPVFLATAPVLNEELLPSSLQSRLTNVVKTYQSLMPLDLPAFFVATYFNAWSEGLLSNAAADGTNERTGSVSGIMQAGECGSAMVAGGRIEPPTRGFSVGL